MNFVDKAIAFAKERPEAAVALMALLVVDAVTLACIYLILRLQQ